MENKYQNKNIVFFDGVCNMCNGLVSFLVKNDRKNVLYYSSLQSDFANDLLMKQNVKYNDSNMTTIYFFKDGKLYSKSTAVLKIFSLLSPPFSIFAAIFLSIKTSWRDYLYEKISKNRYALFGKKETCRLPSKQEASRFIK